MTLDSTRLTTSPCAWGREGGSVSRYFSPAPVHFSPLLLSLFFFPYRRWFWRNYFKWFSYQKSASSNETELTVLVILLTASPSPTSDATFLLTNDPEFLPLPSEVLNGRCVRNVILLCLREMQKIWLVMPEGHGTLLFVIRTAIKNILYLH